MILSCACGLELPSFGGRIGLTYSTLEFHLDGTNINGENEASC